MPSLTNSQGAVATGKGEQQVRCTGPPDPLWGSGLGKHAIRIIPDEPSRCLQGKGVRREPLRGPDRRRRAASAAMMPTPLELRELNRLTLQDQAAFVAAATASHQKSWLYFFPFLYLFAGSSKRTLFWERRDGAICLYYLWQDEEGPRLDLYFPPFPFSIEALRFALERVKSFNRGRSSHIIWVDE